MLKSLNTAHISCKYIFVFVVYLVRISWYEEVRRCHIFDFILRFIILRFSREKGVRRGNEKIIATQKKNFSVVGRSSKKSIKKKKIDNESKKLEKGKSEICATNFFRLSTRRVFNMEELCFYSFSCSAQEIFSMPWRWCLRRKCHNTNRSILLFSSLILLPRKIDENVMLNSSQIGHQKKRLLCTEWRKNLGKSPYLLLPATSSCDLLSFSINFHFFLIH